MQTQLATIRSWFGFTISSASLALFFEALSVLLNAGRSVGETLQYEATGACDPELRQICAAAAPRVRRGEALSVCLRPYAGRFPEIVLPLLEVGEAAGGLADATERLAKNFQQTAQFERKFRFSVYDPRLALLLVCLIQIIQATAIALPTISAQHPLASVAVAIGVSVVELAMELIATYFFGRAVLRLLLRCRPLRLTLDTLKLALPRIGSVARNLSAARWARSFATLWGAGVPISTALEISAGSALNAHYEQALRRAAIQTRQGRSLSESLAGTQMLPAHLLGIIAASEEAGRMDHTLLILAAEMEKDALARALQEMNKIIVFGYVVLIIVQIASS